MKNGTYPFDARETALMAAAVVERLAIPRFAHDGVICFITWCHQKPY